jgi:hypothetical protein
VELNVLIVYKIKNMKLKLLYTGCLLLCLSTIASSNESLRYCHHTAGKVVIPGAIPGVTASSSDQLDAAAPTLIKLLYI